MRFKNKVVWITGASSGIGEALAMQFAKEGAKLVLSARSTDKLEALKAKLNTESLVVPMDMEQQETFPEKVKTIIEKFGQIDLLVNNAGISQRSLVIETPLENDRKIMEVNFFGTIALTKEVLPFMKEKKSGCIVVISSIVGKFGYPFRSSYAASKHAVQGFFESMRTEIKQHGITTTIVSPGRVNTNISYNAITADGSKHNKMDRGQEEGISAESCAAQIVNGIANNKKEILIGGKEKWLVFIRRFFPSWYYTIVNKQFKKA